MNDPLDLLTAPEPVREHAPIRTEHVACFQCHRRLPTEAAHQQQHMAAVGLGWFHFSLRPPWEQEFVDWACPRCAQEFLVNGWGRTLYDIPTESIQDPAIQG